MTVSGTQARIIAAIDPDFEHFLKGETDKIGKNSPSVADVHVSSAGAERKRKKPDAEIIPLDFNGVLEKSSDPLDLPTSFADMLAHLNSVPAHKSATPRALKPMDTANAHSPFPHDPQALSKIPDDKMRRFLGALTTPDTLPDRKVPMKSLIAIQSSIDPDKVASMQENGFDKSPVVVRHDSKNYIVDGHHRAAAAYLNGDNQLDCKFCNLNGSDDAGMQKEHKLFFEVMKADEDEQQIFGWASVVQKGDYLIVDKQGDVIFPESLEKAAYDYVLEARQHGDSHQIIGTGRMIESMVFTLEKQEALGVVCKDDEGNQIVGWWVGFKVDSPEVWKMHKEGKRPEFSIGGRSQSTHVDD